MRAKDLTGQRFGKLTVIARGENSKNGKSRWVCNCDCGKRKEKPVSVYDLVSGKVQSCGCLYKDSNKGRVTHGKTGSRLYRIWSSMKQRCKYPKHTEFSNYGGKGVSVCDEWQDFQTFQEWAMTNGYSDGLTIDRIDNGKGYAPDNCRWATMKEQQNNRSNNFRISIGGEEKTLSEWSETTGIPRATLGWRIKNHWAENELFMPVSFNNSRIRKEEKQC